MSGGVKFVTDAVNWGASAVKLGADGVKLSSDLASDSSVEKAVDSTPDFGGDLAKDDEGVDLNNDGFSYSVETINDNPSGDIGKDLNNANNEQLDTALDDFQEDKWSDLSLDEQKQSMTNLADFVAADTENNNPPEIVFCDDMDDNSYGGYNPDSNTIEINTNMLDDSREAADTISHEMWHAYQEQAANDPNNPRALEYQEGFDNYISPDLDFEGYENQMVESEARDYAQGYKDRLSGLEGRA